MRFSVPGSLSLLFACTTGLAAGAGVERGLVGGQVARGENLQIEAGLENGMLKFWLLNTQGVDATTYESALGLEIRRGPQKSVSECRVQATHFACPAPKNWHFKKGDQLVVTVSRNKSPFEELKMNWPLPAIKQPAIAPAGPSYEEVQAKAKSANDQTQAKIMQIEQARKNYRVQLPMPLMNLLKAVRSPAGTGAPAPAANGCELPD